MLHVTKLKVTHLNFFIKTLLETHPIFQNIILTEYKPNYGKVTATGLEPRTT